MSEVFAGAPLTAADTQALFDRIFAGQMAEDEIVRYLSATADRQPTVAEIVGAVRSMRGHMHKVAAPPGAVDLCGTGGDGHDTLNISTAASFVVAAANVPVAKHGNRSASSKSGAADVLEALGIRIDLDPAAAAKVLADTGMVFLFAQTHHPAMARVAAARKRIKRRTIFNLLGPLANPAQVRRQLVGVYASEWLTPYAEALFELGAIRALVVHGADGLDELTTTAVTHFARLENGQITHGEIAPEDAGLPRATLADLKGGDAAHNAAALRRLLGGAPGPYRDIVLLNAGAALMVADAAKDVKEGVTLAAQALDSGAAGAKLEALIKASNAQ